MGQVGQAVAGGSGRRGQNQNQNQNPQSGTEQRTLNGSAGTCVFSPLDSELLKVGSLFRFFFYREIPNKCFTIKHFC